jgi:hypothetical protein
MKAIGSRAAKRRSKVGGRPRKENVERFACGKIKPSETAREVKSVAIEARMRIHANGNEKFNAESMLAGYTLGRIYLDGKITAPQLKAGDAFAEAMSRYYSLTGIPFPSARAQSLFSVKGHDGEVSQDRATKARQATNKMMELAGVLMNCADGPWVRQTVLNVAVMDLENLRGMPPMQMRWLRRGLERLQAHLGIAD